MCIYCIVIHSADILEETIKICSTYIVVQILPNDEMFCGGASTVTYDATCTILPSHGQVDTVNQTTHNITGLTKNTTYLITIFVLRRNIMIYNITMNGSTLLTRSKYL